MWWTRRGTAGFCALIAALAGVAPADAREPSANDRYSLAGGCFTIEDRSGEVVSRVGREFALSAVGEAEPFRLQAADLGEYLIYGTNDDFLTLDATGALNRLAEPARAAIFSVDGSDGEFTLTAKAAGESLPVRLESADGCRRFPEITVNTSGEPASGGLPYEEVRGLLDMHLHLLAFEAFGGRIHCGRPWSPLGVEEALPDCAELYGPGSTLAPFQNTSNFGSPVYPYDTVGWPTFKDWPQYFTLSFEQTYYRWLERAWRGGLRMMTMLAVDNAALCKSFGQPSFYPCDEQLTVERELRDAYELEDYIDAQNGGPGKGWFRIVKNPFQARRVIHRGKLAVILGIETSQPFGCGERNDVPLCDKRDINRGLDKVYRLGVRQMEIINKFDNAFGGVAGDSGTNGIPTNIGNYFETGDFFAFETCPTEATDQPYFLSVPESDAYLGSVPLIDPGDLPVYPEPPHCNIQGLTELGEHLIRGMIERKMIIDPDHLSVVSRNAVLNLVEAEDYSGIVSSHSWSDVLTYPRVYESGGTLTPYAGSSEGFVSQWRDLRKERNGKYYFGFGYGADMNGFGSQGPPRNGPNPVKYPFKSFDGSVKLKRQRSGEQVYDINVDGVAHYGLYPDWIEDLRMLAGEKIIEEMARGSEAYLQTWERTVGIPSSRCRRAHSHFTTERGIKRMRLGMSPARLLRRVGQPQERFTAWRYCIRNRGQKGADQLTAVFGSDDEVGLILSNAPGHRAAGVRPGNDAGALGKVAEPVGGGLWLGPENGTVGRFVYGAGGGEIRFVGVVTDEVASSPTLLREQVRTAGL